MKEYTPIKFKNWDRIAEANKAMRLHIGELNIEEGNEIIELYGMNKEQLLDYLNKYYKDEDGNLHTEVQEFYDSFDIKKHLFGELYFRCSVAFVDMKKAQKVYRVLNYPYTKKISFAIDASTVSKLLRRYKSYKPNSEYNLEDYTVGMFKFHMPTRVKFDPLSGIFEGIDIEEKYFTDSEVLFRPYAKIETVIYRWWEDLDKVSVKLINKLYIYDLRLCNITTDLNKTIKAKSVLAIDNLKARIEEFKEIKTYKDIPDESCSMALQSNQNFFGVSEHISNSYYARVSIRNRKVDLKYWNSERVAALYVDAAIRTHAGLIDDWERKLNFPNLKQIVKCCCSDCLKKRKEKFPRRVSQLPDHLEYTEEYKKLYKPEEL